MITTYVVWIKKFTASAAIIRISVLKRMLVKTEELRNRFFKRNTNAYPMQKLIKKTFISLNNMVTIVLFGNNSVPPGSEVSMRKTKKNTSITVHDTAIERIIFSL